MKQNSKMGPHREWEVFSFPALLKDDILGRKRNVLWAENTVRYAEIKAMVGRKIWSSLYQQNQYRGGDIFTGPISIVIYSTDTSIS